MLSLPETLDLIRAMRPNEAVTRTKLKIPLRTVRGDVNPKYLHAEMVKEGPMGLPTQAYYERRDNKLKARITLLVEEEERAIDEFCGLAEPTPPDTRTWKPQYEEVLEFPPFMYFAGQWHSTKPLYSHGPRMPPFLEDM